MRLKVGVVETTHPEPGSTKYASAPPPAPDRVKALLPSLADLPKEAETKAATEKELRHELAQLKRELGQAKAATPAAEVKTVEMPVITEDDHQRIEESVGNLEAFAERFEEVYASAGEFLEAVRSDAAALTKKIDAAMMQQRSKPVATTCNVPQRPETRRAVARMVEHAVQPTEGLTGSQQRIIDIVAMLHVREIVLIASASRVGWGFILTVAVTTAISPSSGDLEFSLASISLRPVKRLPDPYRPAWTRRSMQRQMAQRAAASKSLPILTARKSHARGWRRRSGFTRMTVGSIEALAWLRTMKVITERGPIQATPGLFRRADDRIAVAGRNLRLRHQRKEPIQAAALSGGPPREMKKLSAEQRAYCIRVNARRTSRLLKRRRRAARKRRTRRKQNAAPTAGVPTPASTTPRVSQPLRVMAPEFFRLDGGAKHRDDAIGMIHEIRHAVMTGRPVIIDFSATKLMYPCGTLLFTAEVDRLRRITCCDDLIRGNYPGDLVVEQVLQKLGILRMLGLQDRTDPEDFPENVRHWRFATGQRADGEVLEPIVTRYQGALADVLTSDLYDGVVEAMTNCRQHAYEHLRKDDYLSLGEHCQDWWMFSQERDGQLTVAVCDLGIGIPTSLSETDNWPREIIAKALRAARLLPNPDARLIRTAAELHKSRTGAAYRGKGFKEILGVVRKTGTGYLSIMSDRGVFKCHDNRETVKDYDTCISGTLVQWTIPLMEQQHDDAES